MATYKVIQDIEAEDHILGPFTLRQFIYGLVAIFFFYLCFLAIAKNGIFMLIVLAPPGLICAFFAFPFKRDQPTEVWALAKVRFMFKPRRRVWDQSGITELVTITAPKVVEKRLTKEMSQDEVQSRLKVLASTIDSRGWAIKNLSTQDAQRLASSNGDSDRLIDISTIPKPVPDYAEEPGDDMLDEYNNPLAQQFNSMIQSSTNAHRQQLIDSLNNIRHGADSLQAPAQVTQVQAPQPSELELLEQLKSRRAVSSLSNANLHTLNVPPTTQSSQPSQPTATPPVFQDQPLAVPPPALTPVKPVTKAPDPAILNLANNNDLSISAIANEANKSADNGEVIVQLH